MVQLWSGAPLERERATVFDRNKGLKLAGVVWLAFGSVYLLIAVCAGGLGGLAKEWEYLLGGLFATGISATWFLQARRWARINARRRPAATRSLPR